MERPAQTARAIIYLRLSKYDGSQDSPERQESEARQLCDLRGWEVVAVERDLDTSGYNPKVKTPGLDAALLAIKERVAQRVVSYKLDRFTRQGARRALNLLHEIRNVGGELAFVHNDIDTTTAIARGVFGMMAASAESESEATSIRLKSMHAEKAAKGLPNGGTRPFGLSKIKRDAADNPYRDHVPAEVEAIRQAAIDIIAGKSMRSIAAEWTAKGFLTTRGNGWLPSSLGKTLACEYLVGTRKGVKAAWEPILDADTFRVLSAILSVRKGGTASPRHLLSGIARCGKCGMGLVTGRSTQGIRQYRCPDKSTGGCSSTHIYAEYLEDDVVKRVLAALDENQLVGPDPEDTSPTAKAEAELVDLEARKAKIAASLTLDLDVIAAQTKAISERIAELGDVIRKDSLRTAQKAARASALSLGSRWESLDLDDRRRLIEAVAETIIVGPAAPPSGGVALRSRAKYDPGRVTVTWRR